MRAILHRTVLGRQAYLRSYRYLTNVFEEGDNVSIRLQPSGPGTLAA